MSKELKPGFYWYTGDINRVGAPCEVEVDPGTSEYFVYLPGSITRYGLDQFSGEFIPLEPPKSEAERAAKAYSDAHWHSLGIVPTSKSLRLGFLAGAKWQQEREK